MSEDVYKKLAKVLDTLPNGFPESDNGVEIKILKLIFTPKDAEVFCDMRLSFETADQIAERTGRSLDGLNDHLKKMWGKGQIFGVDFGEVTLYKIAPWVFGIFEFQLKRMTKEFAVLCKEYEKTFGTIFFINIIHLNCISFYYLFGYFIVFLSIFRCANGVAYCLMSRKQPLVFPMFVNVVVAKNIKRSSLMVHYH